MRQRNYFQTLLKIKKWAHLFCSTIWNVTKFVFILYVEVEVILRSRINGKRVLIIGVGKCCKINEVGGWNKRGFHVYLDLKLTKKTFKYIAKEQ